MKMQTSIKAGKAQTKGAGGRDIVTAGDKASQQAIFKILRNAFPNIALIGEENKESRAALSEKLRQAPLAFVVDPIDGTTNYNRGLLSFGATAALIEAGKPVAGVLYTPADSTIISAAKGFGCYCNGELLKLKTSLPPLKEALLNFEWGWWLVDEKTGNDVWARRQIRAVTQARGTRASLSAVYSLVELLQGKIDAYVNLHRPSDGACVWDFAAAHVALQEATGRPNVVFMPDGSQPTYQQISMEAVCCPSPHLAQEILALIQSEPD